jgi:hypothetical protein
MIMTAIFCVLALVLGFSIAYIITAHPVIAIIKNISHMLLSLVCFIHAAQINSKILCIIWVIVFFIYLNNLNRSIKFYLTIKTVLKEYIDKNNIK